MLPILVSCRKRRTYIQGVREQDIEKNIWTKDTGIYKRTLDSP